MALIDCEECGKQISDKSQHCVHCGAPSSPAIDNTQKENVLGCIKKINTFLEGGKSQCEIFIEGFNGQSYSTGVQPSSLLKPYTWKEGDTVSFIVAGRLAKNIVKTSATQDERLLFDNRNVEHLPSDSEVFDNIERKAFSFVVMLPLFYFFITVGGLYNGYFSSSSQFFQFEILNFNWFWGPLCIMFGILIGLGNTFWWSGWLSAFFFGGAIWKTAHELIPGLY